MKNEARTVETTSEQMRKKNFFPVLAALNIRNMTRENQDCSRVFRCSKKLCLCSKTYCCYDIKSQKYTFCRKGLNKRTLEDSGDGPMAKYRQVLHEAVNLKSTNKEFKMINHAVATYEPTKKGLSYFNPKWEVECDGVHTKPLNL